MKVEDLQVETYILDSWNNGETEVLLTNRHSIDGSDHWAIVEHGCCLNKSGEWELEPIPSSRDDAFYARCRWHRAQEALDFYLSIPMRIRRRTNRAA